MKLTLLTIALTTLLLAIPTAARKGCNVGQLYCGHTLIYKGYDKNELYGAEYNAPIVRGGFIDKSDIEEGLFKCVPPGWSYDFELIGTCKGGCIRTPKGQDDNCHGFVGNPGPGLDD
ncbi:hypothetical protein M011DRAFT_197547 [Sporormia fimetaria CBS 119925]|uniref:Uncharacterized protein n=1 Tax=Sporormia fimetaria CBS 119925 TaxID=1340428 RepID=A0A6A6V0R1_9PLEO|nr:hypothetical protein M011DRAFT_197547 [Sporormia fimetaria CBS 119925]